MKDLYRIINRNRAATAQSIQDALNSPQAKVNPRIAEAGKVLGNPGRRKQYDRVHHAIEHIAVMRQGTGLQQTVFARQFEGDFQLQPRGAKQQASATAKGEAGSRPTLINWIALGCAGVFLLYLLNGNKGVKPTTPPVEQPEYVVTRMPTFTSDQLRPITPQEPLPTPLPTPATGTFDTSTSRTRTAISVKTSPGTTHTLVKIVGPGDKVATMGFIRAGDTHKFELPFGIYRIKTASGTTWYGLDEKFGDDTIYNLAQSTFPLREEGEYWTVELILQTSGNLTQRRISESEF